MDRETKSFEEMLLERLHAEFEGYNFRIEKIVKNNCSIQI